jgi:integrase
MVKPVRIKPVARVFLRVLRAAHLPHFRLYDLRHTYASHLIAAGGQIDYVAKQLGHSKLTTTLLYYAHWFPKGDPGTSRRWRERVPWRRLPCLRWRPTTSISRSTKR